MATFSNWVASNKQPDVLQDTRARTVLNLINTYERYIQSLNLNNVMAAFQEHVESTNNPHRVLIDNLPDLIIDSLWTYYQTNLKETDTSPIEDRDALVALFAQDPTLPFEWMRCIILNTDMVYQEGVGPMATKPLNRSPFYLRTTPYDNRYPIPWYVSDTLNPDLNYTVSGSYTGVLGSNPDQSNLVLLCSVALGTTDNHTVIWRLSLGAGNPDEALSLTYVAPVRQLMVSSSIPELVLPDGGLTATLTSTTAVPSGSTVVMKDDYPVELRFALRLTTEGITLYTYTDSTFTQQTAPWSMTTSLAALLQYTLSHGMGDNQNLTSTSTRSIRCYNAPLSDLDIQLLLDGEH